MKKVLSMVLAMATVASMASVAFASNWNTPDATDPVVFEGPAIMYIENDDGVVLTNSNMYLSGTEVLKGDKLYIPVTTDVGGSIKQSDMKKWKVKSEWMVGSDLLETNPALVYKKTNDAAGSYQWFVELTTKQAFDTSKKDVLGTLTVYKGSASKAKAWQKFQLEFATLGAVPQYIGVDTTVKNNQSPYVFSFKTGSTYFTDKGDTEVITFDGVGEFEGNFYEQGRLFLGFNTEWIPDIANVYSDAELEFVTFPGNPMFNKWGTMRLYDPDETGDKFVYTLVDGKLEAVETKYDDEYEAYVFGAKQLGTFITSDKELDVDLFNNAVEEEEGTPSEGGDVPTETVKPIPDTGR